MTSMQQLEALTGSIKLPIRLPETRFTAGELDPPFWAPPYSSLVDDVMTQKRYAHYKNKLRQIAMHPVMLHAGQAEMPNGELGRPFAPDPVMVPELLGGRILKTNL